MHAVDFGISFTRLTKCSWVLACWLLFPFEYKTVSAGFACVGRLLMLRFSPFHSISVITHSWCRCYLLVIVCDFHFFVCFFVVAVVFFLWERARARAHVLACMRADDLVFSSSVFHSIIYMCLALAFVCFRHKLHTQRRIILFHSHNTADNTYTVKPAHTNVTYSAHSCSLYLCSCLCLLPLVWVSSHLGLCLRCPNRTHACIQHTYKVYTGLHTHTHTHNNFLHTQKKRMFLTYRFASVLARTVYMILPRFGLHVAISYGKYWNCI